MCVLMQTIDEIVMETRMAVLIKERDVTVMGRS